MLTLGLCFQILSEFHLPLLFQTAKLDSREAPHFTAHLVSFLQKWLFPPMSQRSVSSQGNCMFTEEAIPRCKSCTTLLKNLWALVSWGDRGHG